MAHGAGGKATQALVEGLLAPAFGHRRARRRRRRSSGLALTTDSFVVKPIRFPGGSIGELAVNGTVNDLAVAGARPLALTLSLVLEEGLGADDLRAEVEAIAAAAEAAGVRDRRRRHEGRRARPLRLDVHLHDRPRPARRPRHGSRRRRSGRATGFSSPGSIGEHGTAIMLARGEFELAAEIESDTQLAVAGGRRAARRRRAVAALHPRRHARRRRVGAERARARLGRRDRRARGGRAGAPGGRRGLRDPRHRPDVRRERGPARRLRRARGGGRRARRARAPFPAARPPPRSAR